MSHLCKALFQNSAKNSGCQTYPIWGFQTPYYFSLLENPGLCLSSGSSLVSFFFFFFYCLPANHEFNSLCRTCLPPVVFERTFVLRGEGRAATGMRDSVFLLLPEHTTPLPHTRDPSFNISVFSLNF